MTVLVTGAGGFLGRTLCRVLIGCGKNVVAHLGPPGANLAAPENCVSYFEAEISDPAAFNSLPTDLDAVVHLAGPAAVAQSFNESLSYVQTHVMGTTAMLEFCRRRRIPRFVYVSSAEVYGQPDGNPVCETAPLRPRSPYGAAKVGAESLVHAAVAEFGFAAVILRPFSIYGPGMRRTSILGRLLCDVYDGREMSVYNPSVVRDYCFVDDVAEAIAMAADLREVGRHTIFNVGSGAGTDVGTLASIVADVAGAAPGLRTSLDRDRIQRADINMLFADTTAISRDLGWQSKTNLREGINRTLSTWRQ